MLLLKPPIFEAINICYIKTCIYSFFATRFVTGQLSYKGLKLILSERMAVSLRSSLSEWALFTFRFASSCDFFNYYQKCVNFYSHQFAFSKLVVNFCGISSITTFKLLIFGSYCVASLVLMFYRGLFWFKGNREI